MRTLPRLARDLVNYSTPGTFASVSSYKISARSA